MNESSSRADGVDDERGAGIAIREFNATVNEPVGARSTVCEFDREAILAVWSAGCDRCRRPIGWNIEAEDDALGARGLADLDGLPDV